MIKYCKEWEIPEPEFKHVTGDFVVTFRGKITEEYLKGLGLNERQIKALEYVKKQGNITNRGYQEVNNISRNTASAELKAMIKAGILKSIGAGKRNLKYVMK